MEKHCHHLLMRRSKSHQVIQTKITINVMKNSNLLNNNSQEQEERLKITKQIKLFGQILSHKTDKKTICLVIYNITLQNLLIIKEKLQNYHNKAKFNKDKSNNLTNKKNLALFLLLVQKQIRNKDFHQIKILKTYSRIKMKGVLVLVKIMSQVNLLR